MIPDTAKSFKEKGNIFFKKGHMTSAAKFYTKAEASAPTDPVYPSNLSAALYELGDYFGCVEAIVRAFNNSPDSALSMRLSIRMAKALAQGVRTSSVSVETIDLYSPTIGELETIAMHQPASSAASRESNRVWQDWRFIRSESGDRDQNIQDSLTRLSRLPIMRKQIEPHMEFFHIGTDNIMSMVDGWGPEDPAPLAIATYSPEQLSQLAFLIAGVGDGRHVFGTLIGMHRAYEKLTKPKRAKVHFHLTALDIHPHAIGRDLIMLLLLDELVEGRNSPQVQAEIKATFLYMFFAVIIPPYCQTRMIRVIQDLRVRLSEDPPRLPVWLFVVPDSIPSIFSAIDYWLKIVRTKHTRGMLNAHEYRHPGDFNLESILSSAGVSPRYRAEIMAKRQERWNLTSDFLDKMSDEELSSFGLHTPGSSIAETREWIRENKEHLIPRLMNNERDIGDSGVLTLERNWYLLTNTFLPPAELLDRHPKFAELNDTVKHSKEVPTDALVDEIQTSIRESWKPNITLFDPNIDNDPNGTGYPHLHMDWFSSVKNFQAFFDAFGLGKGKSKIDQTRVAYEYSSRIFDAAAQAVKTLKNRLRVEMNCGELMKELSKMRFRSDFARPPEFPRAFTRIWLSNIPDYTHGLINTAVYILPNLQNCTDTAIASNCMLNTGAFKDDREFIYTYTLLEPIDVPRYLGCRLIRQDAIHGLLVVAPYTLPLSLKDLASKEELVVWLTRQLMYTMVQGIPKPGPFRIRLANNLVAFIGLLVHLHTVGFPSHWLSEFLSLVLNDNLETGITTARQLPIPSTDVLNRVPVRKVRLDPWLADFETTLALTHQGLPFVVSFPPGFANTVQEIGTWEASAESCTGALAMLTGNFSPWDAVTCLLFWKPTMSDFLREGIRLSMSISDILNGTEKTPVPAPGQMFILTAQEYVHYERSIRWKMSIERVKKMRKDSWCMMAYRTDFTVPTTVPVPAMEWKEVV